MKILHKLRNVFKKTRRTSGSVAVPAADPALLSENSPLVAQDGEWRTDKRLLELVIKCILRTSALNDEDQQLVDHLWAERETLGSSQDLLKAIGSYIKSHGHLNGAQSRYITALAEAEQGFREVKYAYTSKGKQNWRAIAWCDGSAAPPHARSMYDDDEIPFAAESKFITHKTPIGSMGSCFAIEIRNLLVNSNFNYVITEDNEIASAAWGGLFNIPSIRQLVEKAFGMTSTPRLLVSRKEYEEAGGKIYKYADPFREALPPISAQDYVNDYEPHLRAAREAFLKCEVFIITLGMTEVWYLKSDGSIFTRTTWNMSPLLLDRRVISYEENLSELQRAIDVLKAHNPGIKIILSVSPVPLHATFQADKKHVISATCHAKSTLRVVAEEICRRNEQVYYFPSYEVVMYNTPNPFLADNRHVTPGAIRKVGLLFDKMFITKNSRPLILPEATIGAGGAART